MNALIGMSQFPQFPHDSVMSEALSSQVGISKVTRSNARCPERMKDDQNITQSIRITIPARRFPFPFLSIMVLIFVLLHYWAHGLHRDAPLVWLAVPPIPSRWDITVIAPMRHLLAIQVAESSCARRHRALHSADSARCTG